MQKIGVISDTHGLLRPSAIAALTGVDLILHSGDVGKPGIIDDLATIAPIFAIRGNVDRGEWAAALPATRVVQVQDLLIYMLHDLGDLDLDPAAAGFAAVISGHSHRPAVETRHGVLYINPGSAGPRRFHLPVTLTILHVEGERLEPRLIDLDPS